MSIKSLGILFLVFFLSASAFYAQNQADRAKIGELVRLLLALAPEARKSWLAQNRALITSELFKALSEKGTKEFFAGNLKEGLLILEASKEVAEITQNPAEISEALNNVGMADFQLNGNFKLTHDYFTRSLRIRESLKDRRGVAGVLNNLGILNLSQSNFDEALVYFKKSLEMTDAVNEKNDYAATLSNIGIIERRRGNYQAALDAFRRSAELHFELKDENSGAISLYNLYQVERDLGRYDAAVKYLQKVLVIQEKLQNKDILTAALMGLGETYYLQGDNERAIYYFNQALPMAEKLESKWRLAEVEQNMSAVYRESGDFDRALALARESLQISEALGEQNSVALNLNLIADAYAAQKNDRAALENYQKALAIFEKINIPAGVGQTLNSIALLLLRAGNGGEALAAAQRAVKISENLNNPELVSQSRTIEGKSLYQLGKVDEASASFQKAIDVIEILRNQISGDEKRRELYFIGKISPYQAMVELFIDEKKPFTALFYAEKAKARVLADVLKSGRVDISKSMTEREKSREQELKTALSVLNKKLIDENMQRQPDATQIARLEKALETARNEYEEFLQRFYAFHPELKARRGETVPLTEDELLKLIPDEKTAFLEYVVTAEKAFLFVATRQQNAAGGEKVNLSIHSLDVTSAELSQKVQRYRRLLGERNLDYSETALDLYQALLKPAENRLAGIENLRIVPDGVLWELPFQALQNDKKEFLLEKFALSSAPSLFVLKIMNERRQLQKPAINTELLAFGNPQIVGNKSTREGFEIRDEYRVALPEAEREVKTLPGFYGTSRSRLFTGATASEDVFKQLAGKSKVIHIAAHSVLDDRNPFYSRILLAADGQKSKEDGLLEAWEIMQLDLNADLVVLSACETARGRVSLGEGLIGMSWAFFVAGTPSTLVSQWKVNSESTTRLMIDFHRNLTNSRKSSAGKAEALRLAARQLMKDNRFRHPYYWAGFVLVGAD